MVFVLNKGYGGWSVSDWAVKQLGLENNYDFIDSNQMNKLVELIKEYGSEKCSGRSAKLKVVEIPDNLTDYEINEYDSIETITYVIDGKLYHA